MQSNQAENGASEILDQKVKDFQSLRVCIRAAAFFVGFQIDQTANLGGYETDVLIAQYDFELLTSYTVWWRPRTVVFTNDLRFDDDALQLRESRGGEIDWTQRQAEQEGKRMLSAQN